MRRAAIYYRVSTDKQDLESQKYAVESWLEALPLSEKPQSITVFQDEGVSGKTFTGRPGAKALFKAVRDRSVDVVIVFKLDRLTRDASAAIQTILGWDDLGVGFISTSQAMLNLPLNNPVRRTMLALMADLAQMERETISERVKAGLAAARKRGKRLGRKPKVSADKQSKARLMKAEGMKLRYIARQLSLSTGTVSQLIRGPDL
jgi:DNA invertase Pin-like site-specific DNA recombinase